jgi:iron(III) transport system ATP-binding protein
VTSILELRNVTKQYAGRRVVDSVSLQVRRGAFYSLLGPSGCGKTTLLRLVAGLSIPDGGQLRLGSVDLTRVPARRRGFGIVFQAYSLFPNMTVADNIGYGLRVRREPAARIRERVGALLDLVQLPHLAQRYPWQLSGGQQQRVAIARAIAVEPKLLLLDEPLSALDAKVRLELRSEIRDLQQRLGILTLMVTHDQEEALTLADRIVCMEAGRIAQIGRPEDLYRRPANRFVADFVGLSNLIELEVARRLAPALLVGHSPAAGAVACIRPEEIRVFASGGAAPVSGQVRQVQFLGNVSRLHLDWPGGKLIVEEAGQSRIAAGEEVGIDFPPGRCTWIAPS